MKIGKDIGVIILLYCIFKEKIPEQGFAHFIEEAEDLRLPKETTEEMANLYKSGVSINEIALIYNSNKAVVNKRLQRHFGKMSMTPKGKKKGGN